MKENKQQVRNTKFFILLKWVNIQNNISQQPPKIKTKTNIKNFQLQNGMDIETAPQGKMEQINRYTRRKMRKLTLENVTQTRILSPYLLSWLAIKTW